MYLIISLHVFRYLHVYLHVFTWYLPTSRKHTRRGELQFALPHGWILQYGQIVVWVNLRCGRISIRPYDTRKRTYPMPVTSFFAYLHVFTRTYMYICQCPDNIRVGANCNSPIHCGQFALSCMWAIHSPNHQKDIKKQKVKNYHSNSSLFLTHWTLIINH